MHRLRHRLGLKGFVGFNSSGLSGGLALFWHESLLVEIQSVNERYIDVYVRESLNTPRGVLRVFMVSHEWRIVILCGMPFDTLALFLIFPGWLLVIFNEALWQEEHLSHTPRAVSQMDAFREVLCDCDLTDLGFSGVPYTYDNKRHGRANVCVRLDRAVACPRWRDAYADTKVQHLVSPVSDHRPILVQVEREVRMPHRQPRRQYEIMWDRESALSEGISNAWKDAGTKCDLADIMKGLNGVMNTLQTWSKKKFGNILRELKNQQKKIELLRLANADQKEIQKASDDMQELLYREEMLWLQCSRISWLKEGDRNTRFFHQKAKWRAQRNKIKKL
jgi:hypothetical protein